MFRNYVVSVSFYCLASQEGQCVKLQTRLFNCEYVVSKKPCDNKTLKLVVNIIHTYKILPRLT